MRCPHCRPLYPVFFPNQSVTSFNYSKTVLAYGNSSFPYCSFTVSDGLAANLSLSEEASKVRKAQAASFCRQAGV